MASTDCFKADGNLTITGGTLKRAHPEPAATPFLRRPRCDRHARRLLNAAITYHERRPRAPVRQRRKRRLRDRKAFSAEATSR
jgi:hypothetical protein